MSEDHDDDEAKSALPSPHAPRSRRRSKRKSSKSTTIVLSRLNQIAGLVEVYLPDVLSKMVLGYVDTAIQGHVTTTLDCVLQDGDREPFDPWSVQCDGQNLVAMDGHALYFYYGGCPEAGWGEVPIRGNNIIREAALDGDDVYMVLDDGEVYQKQLIYNDAWERGESLALDVMGNSVCVLDDELFVLLGHEIKVFDKTTRRLKHSFCPFRSKRHSKPEHIRPWKDRHMLLLLFRVAKRIMILTREGVVVRSFPLKGTKGVKDIAVIGDEVYVVHLNGIHCWWLESGACLRDLGPCPGATGLAVSKDGDLLVSIAEKNIIQVWGASTEHPSVEPTAIEKDDEEEKQTLPKTKNSEKRIRTHTSATASEQDEKRELDQVDDLVYTLWQEKEKEKDSEMMLQSPLLPQEVKDDSRDLLSKLFMKLDMYMISNTLVPYLTTPDLFLLQRTCRRTRTWCHRLATQCKVIGKRVHAQLQTLMGAENFKLFLDLWTLPDGSPNKALYLTGSGLLWALDPSPEWTPRDFDVLLFKPRKDPLPDFRADWVWGDATDDPSYRRFMDLHFSKPAPDSWKRAFLSNAKWTKMKESAKHDVYEHTAEVPGKLDIIVRDGNDQTDPWYHLKGFDLRFVCNAWRPDGFCRIYFPESIAFRTSDHNRLAPWFDAKEKAEKFRAVPDQKMSRHAEVQMQKHESMVATKIFYWSNRVKKYEDRGYTIRDVNEKGEYCQRQVVDLSWIRKYGF